MTCEICGEETEADLCEECAEELEEALPHILWMAFQSIEEEEPESDGFELE